MSKFLEVLNVLNFSKFRYISIIEFQSQPFARAIDDIIKDYLTWKLKLPDNYKSLSDSKKRKWNAQYQTRWKTDYPWIVKIVIDKKVVGILCSICRDPANYGSTRSQSQLERSGGKLVNIPLSKLGDSYEQAQKHEFGNVPSIDPISYRKKVVNGKVTSPKTAHMHFYVTGLTRKKAHVQGKEIDNTMNNIGLDICKRNQIAMMQLCSMLHRCIKRRDAVFSSLKDNVLFCIEVLNCKSLKYLIKEEKKGISNRKITELMNCMYNLAILGIYIEMTENLTDHEVIVFGGIIDLGSKIKKTKEYAGVGVKYICLTQKKLVTRVIGFRRTASKTGLALITTFQEALDHFNDTIKKCKSILGALFPVV